MSDILLKNKDYRDWIADVSKRFRQSQLKAAVKVNSEMLRFYWALGLELKEKKKEYTWESRFYEQISNDLKKELPEVKSFSPRNLLYMQQYYELFSNAKQPVSQIDGVDEIFLIPWGHLVQIINRCKKDSNKALFYVHKTIENNWSRSVLMNFLDTNLYEREGKALTNFDKTLPSIQSDLAQAMTKDPYNFDFLTIRENFDEKELKDALIGDVSKMLLELGKGFAYMGREVRLAVGETEKFLDLLFYNTNAHCYVVVEVKAGDFNSSYAGQLGTYVVAVNHQLKDDKDEPTVGLLVCRGLDKVEAQYALESSSQPLGISSFELSKLVPEQFKGSMPTIEEIEEELMCRTLASENEDE